MRRASSVSPRAGRMSAILAEGDGARADVAEPLVDRQLLLAADAEGLVGLAPRRQDVGDPAEGDGAGADVAEPLVDRQLLLAADAEGLVGLAPRRQDVGDLAEGDGAGAVVA